MIVVAAVLIAAAVTTAVLIVAQHHQSNNNNSSNKPLLVQPQPSAVPTAAKPRPTMAAPQPTVAPIASPEDRFRSILENQTVSSAQALDQPGSPQYHALHWLFSQTNPLNSGTHVEKNMIQRYVLAVIYYANQGDQWSNPLGFLSNGSICEWHNPAKTKGAFCNTTTMNQGKNPAFASSRTCVCVSVCPSNWHEILTPKTTTTFFYSSRIHGVSG